MKKDWDWNSRTHLKAQKCVVATYNPTSKEIETVPGARWLARLIRAGKVWAQGETASVNNVESEHR